MTPASWILVLVAAGLVAALIGVWDIRRQQQKAAAGLRTDHQLLRAYLKAQQPKEAAPQGPTAYEALTEVMTMLDAGEKRHLSRCTPEGDAAYDRHREMADLYGLMWLNVRDMRDRLTPDGQKRPQGESHESE